MVRAVEVALLRLRVRQHDAALLRGLGHQEVLERRHPVADGHDGLRASPEVHDVHVDVGQRRLQRPQGVVGVVLRAEHRRLLRRRREEQHRPPGAALQLRERLGHREHRRHARAVVERAVEDLVALERAVDAEAVPVRAVHDVLLLQRRVAAFEPADHVPRRQGPDRVLHREARRRPERHGLEAARRRARLEGVEVEAARGEERLRAVQRDPRVHRRVPRRLVRPGDAEILASPARLDDVESVAGRTRLVHDDGRSGALRRGHLVLVRPAAVVRQRGALERLRIEARRVGGVRNRRVAREHDDGLAAHVDALEVVPPEFGGDDAVADEHHRRLRHAHVGQSLARHHDRVVRNGERHGNALHLE